MPQIIAIAQSIRIRADKQTKARLADEIRYRNLAVRFPRLASYYLGLID